MSPSLLASQPPATAGAGRRSLLLLLRPLVVLLAVLTQPAARGSVSTADALTHWATAFQQHQSTLPEGLALARQRLTALRQQLLTDPAAVLAARLDDATYAALPAEVAALIEQPFSALGDYEVLAVLPSPGGAAAEAQQRYAVIGGVRYPAFVYGRRRTQGTKLGIPLSGLRLGDAVVLDEFPLRRVTGTGAAARSTGAAIVGEAAGMRYAFADEVAFQAAQAELVAAESVLGPRPARSARAVLEHQPAPRAVADTWTKGPQSVLVIRTVFSDTVGDEPANGATVYDRAYVLDFITRRIAPYYESNSYGQTTLVPSTPARARRLSQTRAYYATGGKNFELFDEARALVQPEFDPDQFDRVIVLFPSAVDAPNSKINYGGMATVGAGRLWCNGYFDLRVLAHELGHTYGLNHAGLYISDDGHPATHAGRVDEYGDVFDGMGANYADQAAAEFNPLEKRLLGWIGAANVQTITRAGTYRIYNFGGDNRANAPGQVLALRLARDATTFYWIGLRGNFTLPAGNANRTDIDRCAYVTVDPAGGDTANALVDSTPATASAWDAGFALGTTFQDDLAGFALTPVAFGGTKPNTYLDVRVDYAGPIQFTGQPGDQWVLPDHAATFSIQIVGLPAPTLRWQRFDGANWTDLASNPPYAGTDTRTLTVTATAALDGARYRCLARNAVETRASAEARLNVGPASTGTALVKEGGTAAGTRVTLSLTNPPAGASYQWRYDGQPLAGSTAVHYDISALQPEHAGLYQLAITQGGATALTAPEIVGPILTAKLAGLAAEVGSDIYVAANGNTFDQVLLQGREAAVTADYAEHQITRVSFLDLDDDIVQVELSGPGTLNLIASSATLTLPKNYNQAVTYAKGHFGLVIVGATRDTHLSVFSVGRATALNPALFRDDVTYDGYANLRYVAIQSRDGQFGGLRCANTHFYDAWGYTGVYAPDVQFLGPVYVGDITAATGYILSGTTRSDYVGTPVLLLGHADDCRIAGGDLLQPSGVAVQVSGVTQLKFTDGSDSHGHILPAAPNQGILMDHGVDVTRRIVVGP